MFFIHEGSVVFSLTGKSLGLPLKSRLAEMTHIQTLHSQIIPYTGIISSELSQFSLRLLPTK